MRLTTLLLSLFFVAKFTAAHDNHVLFENVNVRTTKTTTIVDFELLNDLPRVLMDAEVELWINDELRKSILLDHIDAGSSIFASIEFNGEIKLADHLELILSSVFGKDGNWANWTNEQQKQANTLYSEFYVDAPWRMKKTDAVGNALGIPLHFFLHDAQLVPLQDIKIDNINVRIKNATDPSFGPILTFDTLSQVQFQNYFSCYSEYDAALDIKAFDLNSFVTSTTQTIDFNIDSDFLDQYVAVSSEYWYFTFTIPPSVLDGFDDVVDILVQLEYANLTISDTYLGLRVFRKNEALPAIAGYYRGDTHLHSMYTQNDAEIGLPLCSTKEAAKLIGVDWITTTDHTSDFDNYGTDVSSNWQRIQGEAAQLNAMDPEMIYIAGQEVACNNSNSKLVHMLAYPAPMSPFSLPFIGDGNGDVFPTSVNVASALSTIDQSGGFAYAAHPFATEDELPVIPVNGGIWNVGVDLFPQNGSSFPLTGGSIICNDSGLASDVLYSNSTDTLIKPSLVGGQIWNARHTLESTADELDPWDLQIVGGGFSQIDTVLFSFHWNRFRQGQEMVNAINQLGLQEKNQNANLENWKFYYSGGNDAHGSFNFSNTDDFASLGTITNNAVGNIMTAAYCPNGMGPDGIYVLESLRSGRTTMTDGPMLVFDLSTNGDDSVPEKFMGDECRLDVNYASDHFLNVHISNTAEFGDISYFKLIVGTESGEVSKNMWLPSNSGTIDLSYNLMAAIDSVINGFNYPLGDFTYIRGEIGTYKDLTVSQNIYNTDFDTYHSVTNPIWIQYDDLTELDEKEFKVSVYPNPAGDELYLKFQEDPIGGKYDIYDNFGRLIGSGNLMNLTRIDVSDFSGGLYHLDIKLNSGITRFKFVHLR